VIDQFLDAADTAGLSSTHLKGHSLAELGATYAAVDFYLGHDSGISHLAGSAGVEGLLLFGPTDPKVWAPATDRMQIVQSSDGQLGGIRVEEVVAELKQSKLFAP
jgi:ADP-heptose:LPS heptosyltransferase